MKKLQNKETGEIGRLSVDIDKPDNGIRVYHEDGVAYKMYNSLAELNEKWEDYEEPKGLNEIDAILGAIREYCNEHLCHSEDWEKIKILNTIEEKLMAWKRLEDNGIELGGWTREGDAIYPELIDTGGDVSIDDLDLLFGGKE